MDLELIRLRGSKKQPGRKVGLLRWRQAQSRVKRVLSRSRKTPPKCLITQSYLMYTFAMQKSLDSTRWWDWPAFFLLLILLQTVTTRLVITDWTSFLYLVRTIANLGCLIGMAMGYSRFQRRTTRWLTFAYMLMILPLQWIRVIDQQASLDEQLSSISGRLFFSLGNFFTRSPIEDPLFFVVVMSLAFWVISSWAGFALVRDQNYLGTVLPSAVGLLIIQNYDNAVPERLWAIALFALVALLLLGRLNYLQNMKSWRARRVFLSPDSRIDLTSSMAVAAGVIIIISWNIPASVSSLNSAVENWNRITRPWREFTQKINNAFDALKSTGGGGSEFFSSELALGTGFSLSDTVMFRVQIPDIPDENHPPRFYWQGRVYDNYQNGKWYTTETTRKEFLPSSDTLVVSTTSGQPHFRFAFFIENSQTSLLYAPLQPTWVSRKSSVLLTNTDADNDVSAWFASPVLRAGESYQVEAAISNPETNELRIAGTDYPTWVTDKYLQIPENFPARVHDLALQVTDGAQTPYEQATAITQYLRREIEYSDTVQKAPNNTDPLEWILFDYKKGYCVYYASTEVLMLRSLGIPARMAVGFAQGEYSPETNRYIVRKRDAHAWPEVYFPGIGWVEFEPTESQPALNRPEPEDTGRSNTPPIPNLTDLENNHPLLNKQPDIQNATPKSTADALTKASLYLLPLLIIFTALIIYFSRRYALPTRIPVVLRTTIERSGAPIPNWIIQWERWVNLSPIEKSFESINFGLRLLEHPMPVHATPIERANALTKLLPKTENQIRSLLDEHQTSLYTSRSADVTQARRAAFNLRIQVLTEKVRYIVEGNPNQTT